MGHCNHSCENIQQEVGPSSKDQKRPLIPASQQLPAKYVNIHRFLLQLIVFARKRVIMKRAFSSMKWAFSSEEWFTQVSFTPAFYVAQSMDEKVSFHHFRKSVNLKNAY